MFCLRRFCYCHPFLKRCDQNKSLKTGKELNRKLTDIHNQILTEQNTLDKHQKLTVIDKSERKILLDQYDAIRARLYRDYRHEIRESWTVCKLLNQF